MPGTDRKFIVLSAANPAFNKLKYADVETAKSIARHETKKCGVTHYVAELISAFAAETSTRETVVGLDSEESE